MMVGMSVWTMDRVREARSLRIDGRVSEWSNPGHEGMLEFFGRRLVSMAREQGFTINLGDVVLRQGANDPATARFAVGVAWRPNRKVVMVELRGGCADGSVVAVQDASDTLGIAQLSAPTWVPDDAPAPTSLGVIRTNYTLGGWNEATRRWVLDHQDRMPA